MNSICATDCCAIVLAAGMGKRMNSDIPKVLHELGGIPLAAHVLKKISGMGITETYIVVGHQKDLVQQALASYSTQATTFIVQAEQLGTAHAVLQTFDSLQKSSAKDVLVLYGDVPLISENDIQALLRGSKEKSLSLVTIKLENPFGYGRIIRDHDQNVKKIVEEKDCSFEQKNIQEVNCGIYRFERQFLLEYLKKVASQNIQREFYLTDLIEIAYNQKFFIQSVQAQNVYAVSGVNSRKELALLEKVYQEQLISHFQDNGVTFLKPESCFLEAQVIIEKDTTIEPNVMIRGKSIIGKRCRIEQGSIIIDSTIDKDVTVRAYSHIEKAQIKSQCIIGPFSRLRPEAFIDEKAHVGNFVEIKKTILGKGSKANHLAYLGDAEIGDEVNIGAGTITCNYDGLNKHKTIIKDEVFTGSNSTLVAPLIIGKGSYVAAGSTVNKNIPDDTLAFGRSKQENKIGYVSRLPISKKKRGEKR